MKKLFLLFTVLTISNHLFSQSVVIHKYGGLKDTVAVAVVDSITFLPFQCGLSKIRYSNIVYNTVQIGSQCWLKENLNVGTMQGPANNGVIDKYCYNNDTVNCTTYGGLYQWNEAMQYVTTEGAQGICPVGWHMPTYAEYQTLKDTVLNDGNSLKAVGQGAGAGAGTNTTGFSALLAGGKGYSGGPFQALGTWATFYMGQQGYSSAYACAVQIDAASNTINLMNGTMVSWGMSVRCLKN